MHDRVQWAAARLARITLTPGMLSILVAVFIGAFHNLSFWRAILQAQGELGAGSLQLMSALALVQCFLLFSVLALAGLRRLAKPVAIVALLSAALAAYFMDTYHVFMDSTMLQNVLETNTREIAELLDVRLLFYLVFLGILPAALVARARTTIQSMRREILEKAAMVVLGLAIAASASILEYKEIVTLGRNHGEIRYLVNPISPIVSLVRNLPVYAKSASLTVAPLGTDARVLRAPGRYHRPRLLAVVVGETERADHMSLNGYEKPTNPELASRDVLSFRRVHSCGTSTAVSMPCMFSVLGRTSFDSATAKTTENVLDVLRHAGIEMLWRENNTGCKGICDRIDSELARDYRAPGVCGEAGCFDEALLEDLEQRVTRFQGDAVIVFHLLGSHGPAYFLRYPDEFALFTPTCDTNQLQNCTADRISNTYDNTLLYTDHVLSQLIDALEGLSDRFDTGMLFVSDHGESLGEHGIYLHGLPYFVAPEEQTHVPMVLWLSPGLVQDAAIDTTCLESRTQQSFSHDNLFHSMLGLMGVRTSVYDPALDMFEPCMGKS